MLDIKFIRQNSKLIKDGAQKKGVDPGIVDRILELDEKKRKYLIEIEGLRSRQNKLGKDNVKEAQEIKKQIKQIEPELKEIESKFNGLMLLLPNLPQEDVPVGKSEKDNVVLREVGKKPKFNFEPKNYLKIAEKMDLVDVKRAAKVSGTRFGYIKGELALLEFALIKLAFDVLVKENFIPIIPPVMIKTNMARGTGYFEATDKEDAYYLSKDDLYLVGTSEQSIGAMHADEILKEKALPQRYAGFSTCFRREAGAYGKDTKGILRVHQFDKIEMFSFCLPEKSKEEHRFLLKMEERLMKILEIPYRVLQMCTAEIALPQAAKYDIEAWMPGQGEYRETHSTSTCTDFQARRLNIRYKNKQGKLEYVHTLNGTAFAIGRTMIAIIENYQQKDGSIAVPKAIQKYLNFKTITR